MITDETSAIEFKGKDIITVKNYKRLVFASNHDWVVPRDMDDRRFFVLDVSDVHKEDQEYFAAVHKQMRSGGLEALMYHFLNVDLEDFNPRMMPATDGAGFDMKLKGMDSIRQWLYELLDDGELQISFIQNEAISELWPSVYPKKQLHDRYLTWCKDQNIRHRETPASFGKTLNNILSNPAQTRIKWGNKRHHCYKLPPLGECRQMFESACKEGASIWTQQGDES
jgi:phage/plasmid-associated DNA primase